MKFKLAVSILFISLSIADVFAEAFFAGNASSVNADSGYNALRNPALMSGQKKDSAAVSYFYSYNAYNDISGEITGVLNLKMDVESKEKYNGTLSLSYVKKFTDYSLGIGIRNPDGTDQFQIKETTNKTTGVALPINNKTEEDKKSFALSTVLSFSKDLARDESFGIQFEVGAASSTVKKAKYESLGPKDSVMQITTDKIIGNLNCGYRYVSNRFEFGAILKFGEYVYEKEEYSYKDNLSSNKNSKKVSPYFYRNKGPEYTLGLGYNITNKLLFNFETKIGMPYVVSKNELKDDDDGVFAEKGGKTYLDYSGGATGGFSYNYSRNFNFGFGVGAAVYKTESTDSNEIKTGEGTFNAYSFISGAEIKPAEGVSILFGLGCYYIRQTAKADIGSLVLNLNIDSLYLNAIAGASMSY